MNASSPGQNRRSQRSNLWMAADIGHCGGRISVILRNLSAGGAQVDGDHALQPGEAVTFYKNDLALPAQVAWVDGRRAGLAFADSLDPDVVRRHVPVPKPPPVQCYKRPGFRSAAPNGERRIGPSLWDRPRP